MVEAFIISNIQVFDKIKIPQCYLTDIVMANSSESVLYVPCIPVVLVDPCPTFVKPLLQVAGTAAGILLAPCGLPGKIAGGAIGYVCGSILADRFFK